MRARLPAEHRIHVAAAAVFNARGEVLITRRPGHVHQGGLWEFPGGKLEPDEGVREALKRELQEELGIVVEAARPLIRVHHDYPDKSVLLDVWRVERILGQPHGREGQPLEWVDPEALPERSFPAANLPIITATRLPPVYLITPEPGPDTDHLLEGLARSLQCGVRLVQLRAKTLCARDYVKLAQDALALCRRHGARLLLNADPSLVESVGADGVHLSSAHLMSLGGRPLPAHLWVAASCHNADELAQAQRVGVDFALLSPVLATESHPHATPLGWEGLRRLTDPAAIPVYALGGMTLDHLSTAFDHGAQGIAAIRALWGLARPLAPSSSEG
jgi:8-oxo-dGTP diphosphatase